ncbi:hypothetical protein J4225_00195 [Candidatus Pacearchaeota archaeon]|nr:hypothetical protein [Candidatus Pacearchaeota archaeon]
MQRKTYLIVTAVIFSLISILHFLRAVFFWPAKIGTLAIPIWVSWLAIIISVYLVSVSLNLLKKK